MGCGRLFLSITTHHQCTSISTPYHLPRKSIAIAVQNECYYHSKAMQLQPKSNAFSWQEKNLCQDIEERKEKRHA